jgi:hypothetical protein
MGDGANVIGAVTMDRDACGERAPGAIGDCYKVRYAPSTWAGVYWQYPSNNWGAKPGRAIRPGARRVSAWAKGARGGEWVELHVGGIASLEYRDTLDVMGTFTLTTAWQKVTLDVSAATYDRVIGGFGWVAKAPLSKGGEPIVFYIDGIMWE